MDKSNNNLGLDIYFLESKKDKKKNICISPISLLSAVLILIAGSGNDRALANALHLGNVKLEEIHHLYSSILMCLVKSGYILISNAILLDINLKCVSKPFLSLIETYYQTEVIQNLDFWKERDLCVQIVNDWVTKATKGKITSIIDEFSLDTQLVLLSAIYFQSNWETPFRKDLSFMDDFYVNSHQSTSVNFMYQRDEYAYTCNDSVQVVRLLYEDQATCMYIFLPFDMDYLENNLTLPFFEQAISNMETCDVEVYLPSFKVECDMELTDSLAKLGLAFPNLCHITQFPKLEVSRIKQKAIIEVDEEGTTAAAVTVICLMGAPSTKCIQFRANRPFMYFIMNRQTNQILFMGSYKTPVVT